MLQVRTKFLEEENSRLQDRIDSITKQKQGLDKLVKDYKLSGKDREVQVGFPEPVHHSCPVALLSCNRNFVGLPSSTWKNSVNVFTFSLLDAKVLYQMAVGIKFDDVVDFSLKLFGKVNFKEMPLH